MSDIAHASEGRTPRSSRDRLLVWLRGALLVAAIGLGVAAIARDRDGFAGALASIGLLRVAIGSVAVGLGLLATAEGWRQVMTSVAGPLGRAAAWQVFFITQLGKYLPGSVWTVVGQVDAARQHGLARSRVAVGALLYIGYHVLTGAIVAALVLPWAAPGLVADYPWVIAASPLLLVGLVPGVLQRMVDLALRVLRRPPLPGRITVSDIARTTGWLFASWIAYGFAAAAVALPLLDRGPSWQLAAVAVGAFALAHVLGVVLVPLPAGLGARELVLILALGPSIGAAGATSVAVVLRVIHAGADLVLAGASQLARRSR